MKNRHKQITLTSVAALGAASSAYANIIYFPTPVELENDGDIWFLDGAGGSIPLALFGTSTGGQTAAFPGFGFNPDPPFSSRQVAFNNFAVAGSGSSNILNLNTTQNVTAGLFTATATFDSRYGFNASSTALNQAWGNFSVNTQSYIGFKFDTGSGDQYGWASITWQNNGDLVINEWAYEDPGISITVGAVPEPAVAPLGLGLLAMGAAGMRRYKSRAAQQ